MTKKIWTPGGNDKTPRQVEENKADLLIYVSGSRSAIDEVRRVVSVLRNHHVAVVSTWHEEGTLPWDKKVHKNPHKCSGTTVSSRIYQEIIHSMWFLIVEKGGETNDMDHELGFAIGIKRPCILIGKPRLPQHCLPIVKRAEAIEEFVLGLMTARVRGHNMMMKELGKNRL